MRLIPDGRRAPTLAFRLAKPREAGAGYRRALARGCIGGGQTLMSPATDEAEAIEKAAKKFGQDPTMLTAVRSRVAQYPNLGVGVSHSASLTVWRCIPLFILATVRSRVVLSIRDVIGEQHKALTDLQESHAFGRVMRFWAASAQALALRKYSLRALIIDLPECLFIKSRNERRFLDSVALEPEGKDMVKKR